MKTLILSLILAGSLYGQAKKDCPKPIPPSPKPAPKPVVVTPAPTMTATASASASAQSTATAGGASVAFNEKIPVATAYAPTVYPTVPCFKGVGAGIQTAAIGASFGGGKVDEGCDARELARTFMTMGSRVSACKILVRTKSARKAGITMDDCMYEPPKPIPPAPVLTEDAHTGNPRIILVMVPLAPPPPSPKVVVRATVKKKPVARKAVCPQIPLDKPRGQR